MASSIPGAPEVPETKSADYIVYIRGVFIRPTGRHHEQMRCLGGGCHRSAEYPSDRSDDRKKPAGSCEELEVQVHSLCGRRLEDWGASGRGKAVTAVSRH